MNRKVKMVFLALAKQGFSSFFEEILQKIITKDSAGTLTR